ncbi:glyoxalase [Elizabethkingia sp. HvH-WGS333]|uniref:VOC family protein n=1 Tax=Elizabethkingia TaxID=308865 RepID=UPI00074171A2|nr:MULTISPECIES: VOC family protein [Elizabethkingia]KUG10996.1 glyoxalase [Elizabethkingia miricola]MCL1656519.1 VOC family protein [Elizabethkingia miricola]MCP1252232.1 VOC family protein [Elizabethkingia sp. S0634]MDX8569748.1 VOC family protein [Elizabethkingia sp. HX XZB]MDX8573188.1 VOC family protein [Elizabethkingia sp. HX QKY]
MAQINVYLNFEGNCLEAFEFYKSVFGGEFPYVGKFSDMPPSEEYPVSEADKNKIMHISLPISQETVLMGSDVIGGNCAGGKFAKGNNIQLSVNAGSREEADKLFNGLSAGGEITMPLQDTFWGAYFGMWTDKFGISWMVNYDDPSKQQQHP